MSFASSITLPSPPVVPGSKQRLTGFLDGWLHDATNLCEPASLIASLVAGLEQIRHSCPPEEWNAAIRSARQHPALTLLHEDPFTLRTFAKPAGYAGDATMIDLIYRHPDVMPLVDAASARGREIYWATTAQPTTKATRFRRDLLARKINSLCEVPELKIAALACGFLREIEPTAVTTEADLNTFLALDQDATCIEYLRSHVPAAKFRLLQSGVKTILSPPAEFQEAFHFTYAAGLFDYLSDRLAARLLASMLAITKPGGTVLIANFLPTAADRGYMELVMDWWLIFRTEAQMLALTDLCPRERIAEIKLYRDPFDCIVFLELIVA